MPWQADRQPDNNEIFNAASDNEEREQYGYQYSPKLTDYQDHLLLSSLSSSAAAAARDRAAESGQRDHQNGNSPYHFTSYSDGLTLTSAPTTATSSTISSSTTTTTTTATATSAHLDADPNSNDAAADSRQVQ